MDKEFDIAIIGRGTAAFSAAIKASEITTGGAKIAMIGYGPMGGTCVNVGCIPSKYILEVAKVYHKMKNSPFPGIESKYSSLDFKKVMETIKSLTWGERQSKYEEVLKFYPNVKVFDGKATFLSEDKIEINNEGQIFYIKAFNVIIATGSSPVSISDKVSRVKGEEILDSNTLWDIRELPETLGIIGGGYVALELGQALSFFGTRVTIIKSHETINRIGDMDMDTELMKSIGSENLNIKVGFSIKEVKKENNFFVVTVQKNKENEELKFQSLMVANGRKPNLNGLNLEKAGVRYTDEGIITDEYMVTSNPRIYAAGDVVKQKLKLETIAAREGTIAVNSIFGIRMESVREELVPWGIFTEPQASFVGKTEEELKRSGIEYEVSRIGLASVSKARIINETQGLFKVISRKNDGVILGVQIISPFATEIIMEGAYLIANGIHVDEIVAMTHIFPTIAEGIKLVAQSRSRDISKMSCCME